MKAILRHTRITPKKANLVAGMVRGEKVTDALAILKFMPKKAAKILYKVIHSAASNARNNFHQSMDDLVITKILVTKGPMFKRFMPVSRGRSHPIRKFTSHITVEVGAMNQESGNRKPPPQRDLRQETEKTISEAKPVTAAKKKESVKQKPAVKKPK